MAIPRSARGKRPEGLELEMKEPTDADMQQNNDPLIDADRKESEDEENNFTFEDDEADDDSFNQSDHDCTVLDRLTQKALSSQKSG